MSIWQLLIILVFVVSLGALSVFVLRLIKSLFKKKRQQALTENQSAVKVAAPAKEGTSGGHHDDELGGLLTPLKILLLLIGLAFAFDAFAVITGIYSQGAFALPSTIQAIIFLVPAAVIARYAGAHSILRTSYARIALLLVLYFVRGLVFVGLGLIADSSSEDMDELMRPSFATLLAMIIFWFSTSSPQRY